MVKGNRLTWAEQPGLYFRFAPVSGKWETMILISLTSLFGSLYLGHFFIHGVSCYLVFNISFSCCTQNISYFQKMLRGPWCSSAFFTSCLSSTVLNIHPCKFFCGDSLCKHWSALRHHGFTQLSPADILVSHPLNCRATRFFFTAVFTPFIGRTL